MKRSIKAEEKKVPSYGEITDRFIRRENEITTKLTDLCVDVVLPVFNDASNLQNLIQQVDKTTLEHRLIIVDDASTDPKTKEIIDAYLTEHPQARLVQNERNIGYIASVNRGLVVTRSSMVALISCDLILPKNWLERLVMPLVKDPTVASCYPFTNYGNITSFPRAMVENHLFDGRSPHEIDQAFQEIRSLYTTIPYGSCSCMAMNRQVIHEIGIFDQNAFRNGYGVEIDWCFRAVKAGYRNVCVENLYIHRSHRESLKTYAKYRSIQKDRSVVLERYPEYDKVLERFFHEDPLSGVKVHVFMRLTSPRVKRRTLIIQNDAGHGAEAYIQDQIAERSVRSEVTFLLRYLTSKHRYQMDYRFEEEIFSLSLDTFEEVMDLSKRFKINGIIVNQLSGYPNLKKHLENIKTLAEETGATLINIVHDYLLICPRTTLISAFDQACDVPELSECAQCLLSSYVLPQARGMSIEEWRSMWLTFLSACQEIRVFSQDSLRLIRKAFGNLERIHVMPDRHSIMDAIARTYSEDETIGIGILGDLTDLKGAKMIHQMVDRADQLKLPIRFELLGKCEERISSKRFHVSPHCSEEEFPAAMLGLGIDAIFVSSIYPETFSYTTEQAMEMDLPCFCLPLGAPVEKLHRYDKGLVLPDTKPQDHLPEIIEFVKQHRAPVTPYRKSVLIVEGIHTTALEHFRTVQLTEQLVQQGIVVSVTTEDKLSKSLISKSSMMILMEIPWGKKLKKLLEIARKNGVRIWYQIDTVSYDLHYINGYELFTPEEKELVDEHCASLAASMEFSDGILVPTETMGGIIKRDFPGKSVRLFEGLATYPMRALSRKERQRPKPETDKVVLAFVASRHYGGYEFHIIRNSLENLLEQNPRLHLLVIGEIELPDSFKNYAERIQQVYCKTWQDYLRAMAKADIQVLPLTDTLSSRNLVGISFLMASLLQVPTIASDSKESRRLIYSGSDGILFQNNEEFEEAVLKLSKDPSERYMMGEKAYYRIVAEKTTEKVDEDFFMIFH